MSLDFWTEPRVERLKALFADGLSAGAIAAEIGDGCTRNAVIGKVGRLNLRRGKPIPVNVIAAAAARKQATTRDRQRQATKIHRKGAGASNNFNPKQSPELKAQREAAGREQFDKALEATEATDLPAEEIAATAVRLVDAQEHHCRWPIGDPATEEFRFCGRNKQQGKAYCSVHCMMAYQPVDTRRLKYYERFN